jgi:hypothetical protein
VPKEVKTSEEALRMLRKYLKDIDPKKIGAIEIIQEPKSVYMELEDGIPPKPNIVWTEVTIRMRVLP